MESFSLLEKVPSGVRYLLTQPIVIELVPEDTMEVLRKIDWTKWIKHLVSLVNSDDLIRSIVGEANFVPFERAYGEAYMDELRRIRLMQEESRNG